MAKVDFYILPEKTREGVYGFICRLLDKAYQQKNTVYVHMSTESDAKAFSDLLWTFRDEAFIPHNLVTETAVIQPPIIIGFDDKDPAKQHDILFNITAEIPKFYNQFKRVIEIVQNDAQAKDICRKKFRQYKDENCELTTHDLTKPQQ